MDSYPQRIKLNAWPAQTAPAFRDALLAMRQDVFLVGSDSRPTLMVLSVWPTLATSRTVFTARLLQAAPAFAVLLCLSLQVEAPLARLLLATSLTA